MSEYYASSNDPRAIREIAQAYGFCLVKGLFSPAEIDDLENRMRAATQQKNGELPDLYSCPSLRHVMLDERVRAIAHELLGEKLVYYRETSIAYEETPGPLTNKPFMDFHCDARGTKADLLELWNGNDQEIYPAYRFAVYTRNYRDHSGGLKVAVGSHFRPYQLYWRYGDAGAVSSLPKLPVWLGGYVIDMPTPPFGIYNVSNVPGDLVIFNLRTFHSAGALRPVHRPDLAFLPLIEVGLREAHPSLCRPTAPGPRNAIFFDYGAPRPALDHYIKWRGLEAAGVDAAAGALTLDPIDGIEFRNDCALISLGISMFALMKSAGIDIETCAPSQIEKFMRSEAGVKFAELCRQHREYAPQHSAFDRVDGQLGVPCEGPEAFRSAVRNIESSHRQYLNMKTNRAEKHRLQQS